MSTATPDHLFDEATQLDAADPLAHCRERFYGSESDLVYLDGNSLGRPLRASIERVTTFLTEQWGDRLIRGWDEKWMRLPLEIGDTLGHAALGAAAGQTFVGDSTTVMLYKLARAAVDAQMALPAGPNGSVRDEIVLDTDNFPTDRYVLEGIARERGMTLRWIESDTSAGVSAEQVTAVVSERTALVLLSHVAYRSGFLADMRGITQIAHEAGALVLWDLCHSAGSVDVELDACGVDLAVGCTYKYLNGGPGSPAFAYVRTELHETLAQPIHGWLGAKDAFAMGPKYIPAAGIRRFVSGTPSAIGMLAMQDTIALIEEVGIAAVRAKSIALTEFVIAAAEERLVPLGVTLASPRDAAERGGHVTFNHPEMRAVNTLLWQKDVLPDYRDPGGLRLGLSPLSTSFEEAYRGVLAVRDALREVAPA